MDTLELIKKMTALLNLHMGTIIADSVFKNNLTKLKKDSKDLTEEDCKILVENIAKAATVFVTDNEARLIQSEMEKLLKECSER